jgi:hypothetical protein
VFQPGLVSTVPLGSWGGVPYVEHTVHMVSSTGLYGTTAWIVAPEDPRRANGRVLIDVMNTVSLARFGEIHFARLSIGNDLLLGGGFVVAGVHWDKNVNDCLGTETTYDGPRTTALTIIADFAGALRSDPTAALLVGDVRKVYAYGYSQGGAILRELLLHPPEGSRRPLFDGSLVGVAGAMATTLSGDGSSCHDVIGQDFGGLGEFFPDPTPIPPDAGLVLAFNTETDVLLFGAAYARQDAPNVRTYEIAGSHIPVHDFAAAMGVDPAALAAASLLDAGGPPSPLRWWWAIRALFCALDRWATEGAEPPPSAWFGAPGDPMIARDLAGNALGGIRPPELAAGLGTYGAVAPSPEAPYPDMFRAIAGTWVDRSRTFSNHGKYVRRVSEQAAELVGAGYLLEEDADAIVDAAARSQVGKKGD